MFQTLQEYEKNRKHIHVAKTWKILHVSGYLICCIARIGGFETPDGILMQLCAFEFGWDYLGSPILRLGRTKKYAAFADFYKPARLTTLSCRLY